MKHIVSLVLLLLCATAVAQQSTVSVEQLVQKSLVSIKKGDYQTAITLLNEASRSADERQQERIAQYLGIAYERGGYESRARAVYEDYIRKHPEQAEGGVIQQRLDTLVGKVVTQSRKLKQIEENNELKESTQSQFTVRQFYHGSFREAEDTATDRYHDMGASTDYSWRFKQRHMTQSTEFRFDGDVDYDGEAYEDSLRLRKASYLIEHNRLGWAAQLGRQDFLHLGLGGDVDGIRLSQSLGNRFTAQVLHGIPVYNTRIDQYEDNRRVSLLALRYGSSASKNYVETYLSRRTVDDIEERLASGISFSYSEDLGNGYGSIDYDHKFKILNLASVNLAWTPNNKLAVYAYADYRRMPFVSLENALFNSFNDLTLEERVERDGLIKVLEEAELNSGESYLSSLSVSYQVLDNLNLETGYSGSHYRYSFPEFDTDARSHISETQYDGYVGLKLSGLWNNHISIRTRFRQLEAEEYNSTVTSGQVQIRLGKKFLVSPRLTNRNRQYHNGNLSRSSEPTLAFEYRGKATSLYSELGVNRTVQVSGDTETGYELWYLTVSTVWRFE